MSRSTPSPARDDGHGLGVDDRVELLPSLEGLEREVEEHRRAPIDAVRDVEAEVARSRVIRDLPAEPGHEAGLADEIEDGLVAAVDGDGRAAGGIGNDHEARHLPRRRGQVGGVRPQVVLHRGLGRDAGLAVVALTGRRLDEALGHRDPLERAPAHGHLVVAGAPFRDARDLLDEEHEIALVGQVQETLRRERARPQSGPVDHQLEGVHRRVPPRVGEALPALVDEPERGPGDGVEDVGAGHRLKAALALAPVQLGAP